MKKILIGLISTSVVACATGNSGEKPADQAASAPVSQENSDPKAALAASMVGKWESACFPMNGNHAKLLFDIAADKWHLDFMSFSDEGCKTGMMTMGIDGPWKLTVSSSVAEGVYEAEFGFAQRAVTPHVEGAVGFLSGLKPCGGEEAFAVGQAKSVHDVGCPNLGVYPSADCSTDYDIVTVKGDTLFFGERPKDNNMCSADKRPKKLVQYGFKKVQ